MEENTEREVDGRQARGEARKLAILAAATREFAARGYSASRIVDIAKTAGVTDAGILHHFPTKHELFMSVVRQREDAYRLLRGPITSARDFFDKFIASVKAAAMEPDLVRFRVMLTGASHIEGHPIEGQARTTLTQALEAFTPAIEAGVESGELHEDVDPRQVVLEVLALNEGIRDQWATVPDLIDYPATFEAAAERLYASISR